MFSGIIESSWKIIKKNGGEFTVACNFSDELVLGQSIAHDGACMTVTKIDKDAYTFFAVEESLNRTNFSTKKIWDRFNVERCLRYGDRVDGHFVTGHVDTVGTVAEIVENGDTSHTLVIHFDPTYSDNIVEKGSIALNGTSLTIVRAEESLISVAIIPHTWNFTNLWELRVWDTINIEFDMLGKYLLKKLNK